MSWIDRSQLKPQFQFWCLHVCFTALPSFGLALTAFNTVTAILAMLAGIATFVVGYTVLTSTTVYQRMSGTSLLGEAVRKGAKIRMWISLLCIPLIVIGFGGGAFMMICPDFWAGFAALAAVNWLRENVFGYSGGMEAITGHFFFTYLTVILEGLIISFTLVLLVFFSLLFLNRKASRAVVPDQR